jgi:carbamoylphosphate synthase large subunit
MKRSVAAVTGVGGPAGCAVAHYLRRSGILVVGTDMRPLEILHRFHLLPPAISNDYLNALDALLLRKRIQLLVPTVTEELPKISAHRETIRNNDCQIFVSPVAGVLTANDKWETVCALNAEGISVPRSYCGESKRELLANISLPMLSKPRFGRGGRGVEIHTDCRSLPPQLSGDLIFQEFLEGEEYDVNIFAEPGGYAAVSVVLKKTLLKNGRVGNALTVERCNAPDIGALAEKAVQALRLEGPIDVDIRRNLAGDPFLLEINARVGANVLAAEEVLDAMVQSWRRCA